MSASPQVESGFSVLTEFTAEVPVDFLREKAFEYFCARFRSLFSPLESSLGNIDFSDQARMSEQMNPGDRFECVVISIDEAVSSNDCLGYLQARRAVLLGFPGLLLAYKEGRNSFPVDRWVTSFDVPDVLPRLHQQTGVLTMKRLEPLDQLVFGRYEGNPAWSDLSEIKDCMIAFHRVRE